jgi:hypothetical protein
LPYLNSGYKWDFPGRQVARAASDLPARVLHSFFGYSDAPTPLQLLIYLGYLAVVVVAFLGLRARFGVRAARSQAAERCKPDRCRLPKRGREQCPFPAWC